MAKCPNCSGENADTQRYCGECGTPLSSGTPASPAVRSLAETVPLPAAELPTGTVFAKRYQVIEELGVGGMGRVYRVLDKKLEEEIALKLIRPEIAAERETLEHFKTELKLAREVVHINVARMFDFNEEDRVPYITMEYVRGENLKRLLRKVGRLFAGQAIPIACQICEGLAEAHRLGIVHRDLKPQNVMIDEDGQAKIMDFGLARQLKVEEREAPGMTPGTPAYVSPEQVKGLPADGRSDLYSLGVLLYEMLTGTTPFKAASARELVQKHLTEPPQDPREINPGISTELSQVVLKCLEKEPGKRYQTAAEVQEALDGLRKQTPDKPPRPTPPPWLKWIKISGVAVLLVLLGYEAYRRLFPVSPPSTSKIAVLQASDTSPSPSDSTFDRELQDAVSLKLSGMSGVSVVPSLTVNSVDTAGKNSRHIGRLLKADYLLDLSFRIEEPRLYLKAALIDAKRGRQARTYEYKKNTGDLSSVKDEFSQGISTVLRGDIAEDRLQKTNKGVSSNLDARILYDQAIRLIEDDYPDERSNEVFEEAVKKYQEALALDPDYALALWALGNAYESRYNNTPRDKRNPEDLKLMCGYYMEAFAKNPDSPETNIGLGWYHFNKGEFPKAFDFFKKALKLEPKNPVVNLDAGAFLKSLGLYQRALRYLSRAALLDPHSPDPPLLFSQCLMSMGRFDEAAAKSAIAVGKDPTSVSARYIHASQLIMAREFDKAEKEITAIRAIDPDYKNLPVIEALFAAARGEKDRALAFRGEAEILTLQGTFFYLLLDMRDEAIASIDAGIEKGFVTSGEYLYPYPSLAKSPCYQSLRGMPRFQGILKKQKEKYLKELKRFEDL